jgi:hypothetical protein
MKDAHRTVLTQPMQAISVRNVSVAMKGDRLIAVFTLSARPSRQWIAFFRERSWYSVLDVASARFWRDECRIDLLRPEDMVPLTAAVNRFVEEANLDARITGCP